MLSNRDTPFEADGWALVIEDIKRLNLLIAGGSNDLNAGAIDGTQQALNDLSSALDTHEIDPEAHVDLLSGYLKTSDYTPSTTSSVTYVDGTTYSTAASGAFSTQFTAWTLLIGSGVSGFNTSTGIFTAPSSGIYTFSCACQGVIYAPFFTTGQYQIGAGLNLYANFGSYPEPFDSIDLSNVNAAATLVRKFSVNVTAYLSVGMQIYMSFTSQGSTLQQANSAVMTITKHP